MLTKSMKVNKILLLLQFHQHTIVWFGPRTFPRLPSYTVEMEEL